MKRKLFLNVGVGALSILMAATQITPAFAGSWKSTQSGWNYINDNGSKALGWTQTPSGWYYLDTDSGIMQTGWKKDAAGYWYFLNTAKGAAEGIMLTGWNWIDGYCYYFNPQSGPDQGKLLVNTTTPDGYKVNADGKWEKDGKAVFSQGKGLSSTAGAPENNGIQSAAKKSTTSSKGGSGGGSRGGSGGGSSRGGSSRSGGSRSGNGSNAASVGGNTTENNNTSTSVSQNQNAGTDTNSGNRGYSLGDVEHNANTVENNTASNNVAGTENNAGNNVASNNENAGTTGNNTGSEAANNAGNTSNSEASNNAGNTENNGAATTEETNNDKFAYVNYTKNVNTDFGEYVVVAFKYGTIDDYKVLVDGVDVTSNMTKVDDDGHVVKWLSSVLSPSALQIVKKADNDTQDITLAGGERKNITKTDVKAPKYVLSNGPITKFDYFLETYDNAGKVRKNASKTTFTLQSKKVDSAAAAVPSQYYIPVTEIDNVGTGSIKIKLQLENEEQEKWFEGLNNIKLLSEDHNIINSNLVYNKSVETKYAKVGVINIPLPQNNARSRGDYYVSIGSTKSNERISLPISLVSSTNFKVLRDSTTPNPKVGENIRFRIVDTKNNQSFGNDVGVVMYRVTLTKPDGTVIELPKISGWHNILDIVQITGTDSTSGKVYTDVAGVYTATIYTKGYKTLTKKFEVLKSDGSSVVTTPVSDESKTVDAISAPTVGKNHVGNRESSTITKVLVGGGSSSSSSSSGKKADSVSGATGKSSGKSSGNSDATSGASGSMMINSYLMYDYDLLANAMILNEIGLRTKQSDAVMNWWLEQSPEAIVGEDKSKLYLLNNFVDAYKDAKLEGKVLTFEDYIKSENATTRNIVGNVKNVLENGRLGTIYRYGNLVGEAAPTFEGLIQANADSFTITTDNADFLKNLESVILDGSSALRSDNYLKQYEVSADYKSITLYKSAFNRFLAPIVGTHKLALNSIGFEKIELDLTITDTLEEVELSDVSEKHETDSEIVIKAVKDDDAKKGDFLSKLGNVKVQSPDGTIRDVISASAGGYTSNSVYTVADGKVTLRGGLFKNAGEYTIYLQSSDKNYPVKSIKVNIAQKEETVAPVVPEITEDAQAPRAKSGAKTNSFFNEQLTIKFEGMEGEALDKYLNAITSVTVNEEAYTKAGRMGFGWGRELEFRVHANATFGGRKVSELSVKGANGKFNSSKYDFVVKAEGYKDLTFTMNADGTIASAAAPVVPTPAPVVNPVEIEKVESVKYNNADVYAVTLKGDAAKINEFIEKLNAVEVNGVKVEEGRISTLGRDVFAVDNDNVIYIKSRKIKGFADKLVFKGEGMDDLVYTTSSQIVTPDITGSELKTGYDSFVRLTFDDTDKVVLKKFTELIKSGNATVTVNGVTYNKGYNIANANTYKLSSNMTYGYTQFIDLSLNGFNQASNEVVISSENFDAIRFNVEIAENASASGNRRTRRDLSAVETATSSNAVIR